MHAYAHPLLPYPVHLRPGTIVEHKSRTGTTLVIVSGPHKTKLHTEQYVVRTPEGREVRVLKENLKI